MKAKKKFYALVEFPYPSGSGLHIGHAFTMVILDVLARQKRMAGFDVLYPMGWDAFGLPTENYALKTGIQPAKATAQNTARFKVQMKRLGLSYDWDREINTTDPEYYRWTQWIFIQLFKHGLAYKKKMPVGWCPSCKVILANEEIVDGKCERCGAEAEHRLQSQWLLKITQYADRLADELDLVDYPDYVKASQRNWIGRSQGVVIDYPLVQKSKQSSAKVKKISCYSTRPDTNFGAAFVVMAPEHPLVLKLTVKNKLDQVKKYIKKSQKKSELERTELAKDKTGVFTGSYVLNRLTGKKMPLWVADFAVLTAGTGIVVGVPAHDGRDFQFAQKYGLEIKPVVRPIKGDWDFNKASFTDIDQAEVFNSDFLNGLPVLEAKEKIIGFLVKKGWGKRAKNYHLRDWIFSRQHYWGEPIPMIFCGKCARKGVGERPEMPGWFSVKEAGLPVLLPKVKRYQPTSTGESPLAKIKDWVKTTCPECGGAARRETDTMPNWAGSSWYFLRYCDPKNKHRLADAKKLKYWLPVDLYLGGAEHTTLHLLYSRFWHKFLNDIQVAPGKEPYQVRRQHGVILAEDGQRMSKSRGNVVNPEEIIRKFGADTLRVYLLFMGPYDSTMPWSTKGVEGCYRFLARIRTIFQRTNWPIAKTTPNLKSSLQKLIKKASRDIVRLKHNTAAAAMMTFLNEWGQGSLSRVDAGVFLRLLAPLAPFTAEELWVKALANQGSVHQQPWPQYDAKLVKQEKIAIVIQVNGKVRGQIMVKSEAKKESILDLAKKEPNVARWLKDKKIKKTIFVPGKLINFVI